MPLLQTFPCPKSDKGQRNVQRQSRAICAKKANLLNKQPDPRLWHWKEIWTEKRALAHWLSKKKTPQR